MAPLNVAIIGAGVAGPALAILLKKAGIESTIYDGRARDYPDRGSIVITANGLRVLEHMGLLEQVQRLGYAHESLTILNLKGEVTGHFMYGSQKLYGLDAQRLYRSSLREILLAEANKLAIDIKYDMRCTSVEQEAEDHVTIRFQNGEVVEADFVIGSDGIYSYIKEHVAPGIMPTFEGQIGVWALAERKAWHNPEEDEYARMILSSSGAFVVTPADGSQNHVLFFATIQTHDRSVQEWRELERDKERLKSMLKFPFSTDSWPADIQKLVTDTPAESFFFWPFRAASCERFVSKLGRIILIGDSAHAMPPSAGQGASMALEDAETLAITLSRMAYEYGTLIPEAFAPLRQWESQRKKRIDRVCERTKRSSDLRKTDGIVDSQGRNEAQSAQSEDNLEWLYSYDCRSLGLD